MKTPWDDEIEALKARKQLRPEATSTAVRRMRAARDRQIRRQRYEAFFLGCLSSLAFYSGLDVIHALPWS